MNFTWFFYSVGGRLNACTVDPDGARLQHRARAYLPAWVQYAWPHPREPLLYVVSSDGGPSGKAGETHHASVLRVDARTGAMVTAAAPRALPQRPIHCALDASGRFLLIAFNDPSGLSVHPLDDDGLIGGAIEQPSNLHFGIFAHQIRTTPSNRAAILVTRGNDALVGYSQGAGADKIEARAEEPGTLEVYGFDDGRLSPRASIAPHEGYGFGPRHLDFHPNGSWVYVSIERQNELQMFELDAADRLSERARFTRDSLRHRPATARGEQLGGAVHVHPGGRFVYQSNRSGGVIEDDTWPVSSGGENTLVVYAIDALSGEPTPVQHIDTGSIHVRTFSLHPDGRLLVAASIEPVPVRTPSGDIRLLPAALLCYHIGKDGRLALARSYEIDTRGEVMWWSAMVTWPAR